ncbi:MAG: hypothetical protein SWK76_13940 [Actinomycetota bacterium]|nr:hypothetical protein [Actinomycetota bacterium]
MPSTYCTPEWFKAVDDSYKGDETNVDFFKSRTARGLILCYLVKADPKFGLESDICFCNCVKDGIMAEPTRFVSMEEAHEGVGKGEYDEYFLIASSPTDWKRVIQKNDKFVTNVVTLVPGEKYHKIECIIGDKVALVSLAPYGDKLVENYNRVETIWPDDMSADELEKHVARMKELREEFRV